jgi:hypothetical protein
MGKILEIKTAIRHCERAKNEKKKKSTCKESGVDSQILMSIFQRGLGSTSIYFSLIKHSRINTCSQYFDQDLPSLDFWH